MLTVAAAANIHPRCFVAGKPPGWAPNGEVRRGRRASPISARFERPLEEIYGVTVERGVSPERLAALGVERWSTWKTGKSQLPWDWQVDQQVYIVEGEVRVVPEGSPGHRHMRFVAGDLVRYPKWFEADLFFNGPYEERYRFRAYGDDD